MNFLKALEELEKDRLNKGIRPTSWAKLFPGACIVLRNDFLVSLFTGTTSRQRGQAIVLTRLDYLSEWEVIDEKDLNKEYNDKWGHKKKI